MDFLPSFAQMGEALLRCLNPVIFLYLFGATTLGIVFGALPGLTATMAVALLTSLTYGMDVFQALAILIATFIGAVYGGSRSAILVNIPGTPAAAATCIDGYPLAQKGKAQYVLSLATSASFFGTVFGLVVMFLISPILASFALKFGAHEYFLLALFGIMICGTITSKNPIKGWMAGLFGLLISSIGLEAIQAYPRFTYGNIQLNAGITLIPAMIGVFAIPEVITTLQEKAEGNILKGVTGGMKELWDSTVKSMLAVFKYLPLSLRTGLIGTIIGALPGAGADIACWVAYDFEKRINKNGDKFGTGVVEGVLAPEVANNSMIGGAFVPMLTLAIPGDAVTAVILAALWLHGVRPGPLLMAEQPVIFYNIVALIFFSAIVMFVVGQLITPVLVKVVSIPKGQLMPVVVVLSVIGSYAINNRVFDVFVMIIFGFIGYYMKKHDFVAAPLTLGIILGGMADENLRRALLIGKGSLLPFVQRPISLVFVIVISAIVALEIKKSIKRRKVMTEQESFI